MYMHDTLIRNAMIVDGSASPPFLGDVAIKDGKISRIAQHMTEDAAVIVEAAGEYLTPGFIDIHRHSDAFVFRKNFGEVQLRQGITATINGNCGLSIAPCPPQWKSEILRYLKPIIGSLPEEIHFETFSEYLTEIEKRKLPIHFGMLVGNGTLRMAVKGFENGGRLSPSECAIARRYLHNAIEHGAFGVSMGVVYMPENMYSLEGFLDVLAPIKNSDIPLVTHIRGEGDLLIRSLKEVIQLAKILGVPLHISHFKCVGKSNWETLLQQAIELLDTERKNGVQITVDVYPWTAGSTQLIQLLPPEYLEGGVGKTVERLKDPVTRAQCRAILEKPQSGFENLLYLVGWENIMITTVQTEKNQQYIGKRIPEIAAMRGSDAYDAAFDLLVEEDCNVAMVNFIACDEDIQTILQYPFSYIISDSIYPDSGQPHPRQYGTFPKILEEYVKRKKILTIEQAIHKFTGAPAAGMKILGKGFIREGYDADITIFDLNKIQNHSDYLHPDQLASGFSSVFVNGQLANDHDQFLHTKNGQILRRNVR